MRAVERFFFLTLDAEVKEKRGLCRHEDLKYCPDKVDLSLTKTRNHNIKELMARFITTLRLPLVLNNTKRPEGIWCLCIEIGIYRPVL